MANNYKVKTYSNSTTGTSQALFTASAATTLVKSVIVNCDKTTPNVNAILRIKKSGGTEEMIKRQNITLQTASYEMLYDVLPLEVGDALYAQSDDTDITWIMSWVENTTSVIGQSIDVLSDVDTTGKANGDVLTYNSTTGNWEAEASAGGSSFGTIAVAGQSNVVADASNDTLTLAAANSNIVLTTNATTDTVTIALGSDIIASTVSTTGAITALGNMQCNDLGCVDINASGNITANNATLVYLNFTGGGTTTIGPNNALPNDPADLEIRTNGNCDVVLDYDDNESSQAFRVKDGDGNVMFSVDEDGISVANGTASTGAVLRLGEATANGTNYVGIQAPASLAANTTYTLPSADGTSGQVLATDSTGGLSWATRAANSFETISVATQSNVVADGAGDTLTFAVAGGMAITTNATTDTITFNSARLDDDDVTLSGLRQIDLNGENLNIVNGAYEILMIEADGVRQANTVIADYAGTVGGKITLAEATANGGSSIAIQAPASLAASTTYTLPSADGTSGQVLATNAAGGLSWTTRAANSFETIAVAGQSSIVADTHTDTLTIAAGTGITLTTDATTDTLTITNSGTANNTFSTIAVAGQSNVVADSASDTLTLVAGSNITLTTNATTDTITIAASGGGTSAGSTGQIQYNNAGAFGAEAALYYDATNNRLSVGGNAVPTGTITSRGAGTTIGTTFLCEDSGGAARFTVYDRGTMFTNERSDVAANVHSFVFNATKDQYWRPTIAFKNTSFTSAIAAWLGDTNTLGYFGTLGGTAATGGLGLYGASSNTSASNPTWQMQGFHGSTAPTEAIIRLVGTKYSGSGSGSAMLAALADSEIILKVITSGTATGALTRTTILGSGAMGLRNDAPTSSTSLTVRGHGTGTGISLLVENSGGTARFTVRDDGAYAFAGGTVGAAQTGYTTFTNLTTDRTCDANATTVEELADILGTLIVDLKTKGIIAA